MPESSSARLRHDGELLAAVQREAARELARDPRARGMLYVGGPVGAGDDPLVQALPAGDAAARGRSGRARLPARAARPRRRAGRALVTEVYLDGDKRFDDHAFALFLSEHSAYALPAGPGGRVFHTSDAPLVDALVAKLQNLYDLQPL